MNVYSESIQSFSILVAIGWGFLFFYFLKLGPGFLKYSILSGYHSYKFIHFRAVYFILDLLLLRSWFLSCQSEVLAQCKAASCHEGAACSTSKFSGGASPVRAYISGVTLGKREGDKVILAELLSETLKVPIKWVGLLLPWSLSWAC